MCRLTQAAKDLVEHEAQLSGSEQRRLQLENARLTEELRRLERIVYGVPSAGISRGHCLTSFLRTRTNAAALIEYRVLSACFSDSTSDSVYCCSSADP